MLETYAFPVKMRYVREAIRERGDSPGAGFWLWLFHCVISIILLFLIAGCFGFRIEEGGETELPRWIQICIPLVVIKELVLSMFVISMNEDGESREPDPRYLRPSAKERFIDVILICYACLVWSATWGAITIGLSMEKENPPMFVVNLFVSALLFLIFYLPLRIRYWIEETAQLKTGRTRRDLAKKHKFAFGTVPPFA